MAPKPIVSDKVSYCALDKVGGETMDEYIRCRDCQYLDTSERDGYKCYCEWYRTYEDPDKVQKCEHYRED